jgi:hypothetical protein
MRPLTLKMDLGFKPRCVRTVCRRLILVAVRRRLVTGGDYRDVCNLFFAQLRMSFSEMKFGA